MSEIVPVVYFSEANMKTNFSATILADSVYESSRLVTMELTYPRMIHSEFLTHRSHSRNAASSRAIPVRKMLSDVWETPFVPTHWGHNQSGMQARTELTGWRRWVCRQLWLKTRLVAIAVVWLMSRVGLHKQIANRILEPWMWITVIATANERGWNNLFKLRCHPDAEPHFQTIAVMARNALENSTPKQLEFGEWHLPLTGFPGDETLSIDDLVKCCVGRCARVSYLTHDGIRDPQKDIELHDTLLIDEHWSPFDHPARAIPAIGFGGNFGDPWYQYRKSFPSEFA